MVFTVIALAIVGLAAFQSTAKGDGLRRRVTLALSKAGISQKQAALIMGLTESRLSEALNGRSPLSVWRLAELPDDFWDAFMSLEAEARDGLLVSAPQLARLLRNLDQLVMARGDLSEAQRHNMDRVFNPTKAVL